MSEEYVYIKGQGWVIGEPFEVFECVDRNGVRIRLERRHPVYGEHFFWGSDMSRCVDHASYYEWNTYQVYDQDLYIPKYKNLHTDAFVVVCV